MAKTSSVLSESEAQPETFAEDWAWQFKFKIY